MTARALQAIGRIPHPPAWLDRPPVAQVMAALDMRAARPGARFVGGCVRDALLTPPRDTLDVDVATVHPPPEVQRRLRRAGVRTAATGIAHGTITALPPRGEPGSVEVTTLRRDVRTFGRSADVAFSEDWVADAERRDFTINALYAGPDLRVFGAGDLGLRDLARGHVRFIGTAAHRIHEDYLRILRYFRMFAWFGGPAHDRADLNAIAKSLPGLRHVSGERVRAELLRLLAARQPVPAVAAMAATGTLQRVAGGWRNPASPMARGRLRTLGRLVALERGLGLEDPGRRLCALVDAVPGDDGAGGRLRLTRAEARRLRTAAAGGRPGADLPRGPAARLGGGRPPGGPGPPPPGCRADRRPQPGGRPPARPAHAGVGPAGLPAGRRRRGRARGAAGPEAPGPAPRGRGLVGGRRLRGRTRRMPRGTPAPGRLTGAGGPLGPAGTPSGYAAAAALPALRRCPSRPPGLLPRPDRRAG